MDELKEREIMYFLDDLCEHNMMKASEHLKKEFPELTKKEVNWAIGLWVRTYAQRHQTKMF